MFNYLSSESKKSINVLIMIWFSMFTAQLIYLILCIFMQKEGLYKAMYKPEVLNNTIIMNINIHTIIYILAILILVSGYIYFKNAYSKLIMDIQKQNFKDIEKEFKYFKEKYLNIMFVCLAVFEMIAILGIIVFLTTEDLSTMIILIIIAMSGFLLVIPNKSKFTYNRM